MLKILITVVAFGVPMFLQPDQGSLRTTYGLFNAQYVAQASVFACAAWLFFVLMMIKKRSVAPPLTSHGGLANATFTNGVNICGIYYLLQLIITTLVASRSEIFIGVYRISEWFLAIMMIATYFSCSEDKSHSTSADLIALIKWIVSWPAILATSCLVAFPDVVIETDNGYLRLGASFLNTNILGISCTIGATIFWLCGKTRLEKVWSVLLFALLLLTFSRTAIISFVVAFFVAVLWSRKPFHIFFALLAIFSIAIVITSEDLGKYVTEIAARGEESQLTTLNSRTEIWDFALRAIGNSPLAGYGFVVGPPHAFLEYWGRYEAHAHNDIVNAALSGGVVSAFFVSVIYIVALRQVFRAIRTEKEWKVLLVIVAEITVFASMEPVLSRTIAVPGVVLIAVLQYFAVKVRTTAWSSRAGARKRVANAHFARS